MTVLGLGAKPSSSFWPKLSVLRTLWLEAAEGPWLCHSPTYGSHKDVGMGGDAEETVWGEGLCLCNLLGVKPPAWTL